MKIYLTRAQSRAMLIDHPQGDPTGGAPYGERRDPISGAIALAEMWGTGTAVMAGTATFMEGLTFAGGAMGLIGQMSGNKTLASIGAIAGMAGGIGSMMSSASAMDTTAAANPPTNLVPGASPPLTAAANPPANLVPGASPPMDPLSPGVDVYGYGNGTPDPILNGSSTVANSAVNAIAPTPTLPASLNSPYSLMGTGSTLNNPGNLGLSPGTASAANGFTGPSAASSFGSGVNDVIAPKTGMLSSAMNFVKENPMMAYIGAQAVGGITDQLSGLTPAKIAQLKAQTAAQNLQIQMAQQGIQNLNQGALTVSPNISINPNPVGIYAQSAPGLISSARPA